MIFTISEHLENNQEFMYINFYCGLIHDFKTEINVYLFIYLSVDNCTIIALYG